MSNLGDTKTLTLGSIREILDGYGLGEDTPIKIDFLDKAGSLQGVLTVEDVWVSVASGQPCLVFDVTNQYAANK